MWVITDARGGIRFECQRHLRGLLSVKEIAKRNDPDKIETVEFYASVVGHCYVNFEILNSVVDHNRDFQFRC